MSSFRRKTFLSVTTFLLLTLPLNTTEVRYTIIQHPNSDPLKDARFGHSVAVLDWNADGVLDIAGGAPGEKRVYVFLGPGFSTHETVTVDGLSKGDHFGNQITAGNLGPQRTGNSKRFGWHRVGQPVPFLDSNLC